MKSSTAIILLIIGSLHAWGQSSGQIGFGFEAGLNYANSTEETAPLEKKGMFLPQIGFVVNYTLSDKFGIQSGLFYSAKGQKAEGEGDKKGILVDGSVKLTQQVLQIPVLASFKFVSIDMVDCFFSIGPYIAYGVDGKAKAKGNVNGIPFEKESDTFGKDKILKRFDSGLKMKISSEVNHLMIGLSYEIGLLNVGNKNIIGGDMDYANRVSALTIGYFF